MSCKQGGYVTLRFNTVATEWHQLCAQALSPSAVHDEPTIYTGRDALQQAQQGNNQLPELRGDVAVRGFWARNTTAIFDVRITDTDARTYNGADPAVVPARHEKWKKAKYLQACLDRRRQFTPLVFSVDGMRGKEADAACKRLAALLAQKWKRTYSEVCGFVRSCLQIAAVRSASLSLRGDRDPLAHAPRPQWECGNGLGLYSA